MIYRLIKLYFLFLPTLLFCENKLNKITLQFSWLHQFEYAGYYAAKEKGFYSKAGFDVEFLEMNYEKKDNVADDVISGKIDYAIGFSSIIKQYLEGKPIVFIANFLKHSPLVIATQEDINLPSQLSGKRFMGGKDSLQNTSIYLMLNKFNIDESKFIDVAQSFRLDEFINKEVDAMPIFLTNQIYKLNKLGVKYNILNPETFGAEFYANNLFTSQENVLKNRKEVKAFKEATIKGWEYALKNKDELINIILEKYNTQNKSRSELDFEAIQINKLMISNVYPVGSIDPKRVKRLVETYIELGVAPKDIGVNYINDFIFESKNNNISLTKEQEAYLKNKKTINLCIDPNWMPFERIDHNGNYVGITSEYFEIFKKKLPIPIKLKKTRNWEESLKFIKNKQCDVLSAVMPTVNRSFFMNFTNSYLSTQLVLVSKSNVPFIENISAIKKEKIGIVKGYSYSNFIKKAYPYLQIIEVNNIEEGLKKVSDGELFGYVGALSAVAYNLKNKYVGELKIASDFNEKLEFSMAVVKDEAILFNIFEQLLKSIDETKRQNILNKYISITFERKTDFTVVLLSFLIILIILLISFFWNMKLKKEKIKTEVALEELKEIEKLLEEKNERLTKVSLTDPLTKIYNREKLHTELRKEISRSERSNNCFSLILLDIDYFKIVNDKFGHQVGDKVLVEFTKIISTHVRKIDTFGRLGGEEFLIICPNTNKKGTLTKAETIKKLIEENNFSVIGTKTASIGVSTYKKGDTEKTILHRADMAMYSAKRNGRNMVIYFD